MPNTILAFINNFKKSNPQAIEKAFTEGNCYWFAKILEERFGGVILYNPVENHFAWVDENHKGTYDITGQIKGEGFSPWDFYYEWDPSEDTRIEKQCVNLEELE